MSPISPPKLDQIPADRRLVDELYAHGKITFEAKEHALGILHPADKWGMWISRLLLAVGSTLVLCGIVYFFAFNWNKISPLVKLSSLQLGLVGCLIGAYIYSLNRINGQILLLAASVLTGIFMAVFGQVYQTGADAYQLFMVWSLLTFGWTLISNFAPQWILWLVITNMFLILWWEQAALPTRDMQHLIFTYLTVLNGCILALREYFSALKNKKWLKPRWIRILLICTTLLPMLIPVVMFVIEGDKASPSLIASAMTGFIGHNLAYYFYRYKLQDMWCLAAIILSACIMVEVAGLKLLAGMFDNEGLFIFLPMGIMTLGIFTIAVIYLRKIIHILETNHA